MKKIKNYFKNITYFDMFLIISMLFSGMFIIMNFAMRGEMLDQIALGQNCEFSDYYMHIIFASMRSDCYMHSWEACFPPLAYVLYYFLYRNAPIHFDKYEDLTWKLYTQSEHAQLIFLIYNLTLLLLLIRCFSETFKKSQFKYSVLFPITIIFSYPMLCTTLERGNSVWLVCILICAIWLWIDDKSKIKKEMALIGIAVAAGFKIYPAIIGLELIRKRDFKAVFRLFLYGIITFFTPFLFFGKMYGMKTFFSILLAHNGWDDTGYVGTVRGAVMYFIANYAPNLIDYSRNIGTILSIVFLAACIVMFFLSKKKWQRVLFISGILAHFVGSNCHYTILYYLPALLELLKETENVKVTKNNVLNTINYVLLAVIFSVPFFFIYIFKRGVYGGVSYSCYILLIINMIDVIIRTRKNKVK